MKTAIFYKSHIGTTKTYMLWLQKIFDADIYNFQQFKEVNFKKYDTIIVASGTYLGHMPLVKFLKRTWPFIKNKKVVAVAVGAMDPRSTASIKSYNTIPQEIKTNIKYFKLPGKIKNNLPLGEIKPENIEPIVTYLRRP